MRCSKCGTNNPSTNNFCAKCGKALAIYCAKCGAENPPTSNFCGKCGAPLTNGAGAVRDVVIARISIWSSRCGGTIGRFAGDRGRAQDGHGAVRGYQGLDGPGGEYRP